MKKITKYKINFGIQKNIFGKKIKFFKKLKNSKWNFFGKKTNPFWKTYLPLEYKSRLSRLYLLNLKMRKQIKLFYGKLQKKQLLNLISNSKNCKKQTSIDQTLESRLSTIIFRAGFSLSMRQAYQMINHGMFLINKKPVTSPGYRVKPFDLIQVSPEFWKSFYTLILIKFSRKKMYRFNTFNTKCTFVLPCVYDLPKAKHLEINFKCLTIVMLTVPNPKKIYFPQHLNFTTLK